MKPDKNAPKLVNPAAPNFAGGPVTSGPAAPAQKAKVVKKNEVVASLRMLGKGWDDELEALFAMPEQLYLREEMGGRIYSKDEDFGFLRTTSVFQPGVNSIEANPSDYGIEVSSTSNNVYISLVDMSRRIIVRDIIMCIMENPPERDWASIKGEIKAAMALAETENAKKEGQVAVYDSYLHTVKAIPKAKE